MKKCPTCGKTFDDNMRFCQTDGTPLVDDAPAAAPEPPPVEEPAFDPYATIVGVPKSAMPPSVSPETPVEPPSASPAGEVVLEPLADAGPSSSADAGAIAGESASSIPVAPPDDILDLGDSDPLKTMYVSDTEMKEVLGSAGQGTDIPVEEIKADEAEANTSNTGGTDFGSISPPPSPFSEQPSAPEDIPMPAPPSFLDTPPLPQSEAETQVQQPEPAVEPEPSYQDEAPTIFQSAPEVQYASTPQYADPAPGAMQNQDWTPPPAPQPEWQNQQIGSNTPFQPPPAGAGGENKTLAIVSLVLGILSICCYVGPVTGLVALITGFMAYKKAGDDPQNYGGKGLALAGMITGGLFMVVGVVYYILIIIGVAAGGLR